MVTSFTRDLTITADGSSGPSLVAGEGAVAFIVVSVKNAPTGASPTLTVSAQEVAPTDYSTLLGSAISLAAITAAGTYVLVLPTPRTNLVRVSWTLGGTTPSFTGVTISATAKPGFVPVGSPGSAVLPAVVQVGGSDGTDARTLKTDTSGRLIERTEAVQVYDSGNVAFATALPDTAIDLSGYREAVFLFYNQDGGGTSRQILISPRLDDNTLLNAGALLAPTVTSGALRSMAIGSGSPDASGVSWPILPRRVTVSFTAGTGTSGYARLVIHAR